MLLLLGALLLPRTDVIADAGDEELRAEAARSQRRVDMGESGLRVVGEGGAEGEAGPSLSDKAEELLDCVYLYFQGKYGNLLEFCYNKFY